jgi:hypothetical protein
MPDRPRFLDDQPAFMRRLILSMALSPPPSRGYFRARLDKKVAAPPTAKPRSK